VEKTQWLNRQQKLENKSKRTRRIMKKGDEEALPRGKFSAGANGNRPSLIRRAVMCAVKFNIALCFLHQAHL